MVRCKMETRLRELVKLDRLDRLDRLLPYTSYMGN